jgi:hypothetical protein
MPSGLFAMHAVLCRRYLAAAALILLAASSAVAGDSQADIEFFEQKIRPVLAAHCYKCHSAESKKLRGGLRLDSRDAMRKGGDSGPAVIGGDPDASLLIKALRYEDQEMPPAGKLSDKIIADFETWVRKGAADPRIAKTSVQEARPRTIDIEAGKRFWSFQAPHSHTSPDVQRGSWPQRRIDTFVLAKLEEAGLQPAPAADPATWLRRVNFDLIGLPPAPEEVDAFRKDLSAAARERVVDGLLASPHFGERWARPWLDLARFAEDQAHIVGEDRSLCYPNAYLYRDWVIRALNADMPYDRFVTLQLAADLVEPGDPTHHVALGFLGLGPKYYDRGKAAVMADEWEDRVDVVSRGLLGLTLACARCHDHKYDPIPTEDYYALAGVFASTEMFNRPLDGRPAPVEKDKKKRQNPANAMHVVRETSPRDLNVLLRGDVQNKGAVVRRHFVSVLCPKQPQAFVQGSGRRELAEAVAARDNPLTARVLVNRIWGQCFGRPLVGTPSNFGSLGERPTHPELLDDLAVRFMDAGWSLKWLLREMVLSATYGQSGQCDAPKAAADPDNRLLGRMPPRRLGVEAWRDATLAAAGRLEGTVGGPSIDPQDPSQGRRTVYSGVSRLELNRLLALFDFPDPNAHAARRVETTTPLQKLFVLNSRFMTTLARAFAERLTREVPASGPDAEQRQIDRAYRLLYGRSASGTEVRLGLEFLMHSSVPGPTRWPQYAQVLLAANEMLYVD